MPNRILAVVLMCVSMTGCGQNDKMFKAVFTNETHEHKWAIKSLNPQIATDWTSFEYLTFDMKSSSAQRWYLRIYDVSGVRQLRMHPFQGVWIRISVPLKYIKQRNLQGQDVATMGKMSLATSCIGFTGRVGSISHVDSLGIFMEHPIGTPLLELRDVRLTMSAEDALLERGPVMDEFGQWIPQDGGGVAGSVEELQSAWQAEEKELETDKGSFNYCRYGGYAETQARATGFFRVEKIDDRWWLVDPDGHMFFSNGATTMSGWNDTRFVGRKDIFKESPPEFTNSKKFGTFADGKLLAREGYKSFYAWNLYRRFGSDWYKKWVDLTIRRMDSWGLNTIGKWGDPDLEDSHRKPYVLFLRGWGIETGIMGMPDIYAPNYVSQVDSAAFVQCAPKKNDPYLFGYLVGQEPPWVDGALDVVNLVLQGPETPLQQEVKKYLKRGDTPENRRAFIYDTYEKFLDIVNSAIRKYDLNHLVLGYGFAGRAPTQVINASKRCFDIFSFTSFNHVADPNEIQKIYELTGLPVMIGEFHFGTPGRGLAAGLVQVKSLEERGVAYRYYVENTAAHPAIVGIHWFQWVDQPATGRMDGENYNTGFIDITDRPYDNLVEAMKQTNRRLLRIHSGKELPVTRKAEVQ